MIFKIESSIILVNRFKKQIWKEWTYLNYVGTIPIELGIVYH